MEKNGNSKVIALIALFVAVVGLSLGFAAYSTSLQISSTSDVKPNDTNWNVGFSTDGLEIENVTTARTKAGVNADNTLAGGTVDVTKYTIGQTSGANATLKTVSGSQVTYSLSLLNKGSIPAYLDSVDFSNVVLTCTNAAAPGTNGWTTIEGTENAGTKRGGGNTTTISNEDCAKMFDLTVSIAGTEYTSTYSGKYSHTLPATNGSAPVIVKLAYKGDAAADAVAATLDGDITVSAGNITVVYVSTNPNS